MTKSTVHMLNRPGSESISGSRVNIEMESLFTPLDMSVAFF